MKRLFVLVAHFEFQRAPSRKDRFPWNRSPENRCPTAPRERTDSLLSMRKEPQAGIALCVPCESRRMQGLLLRPRSCHVDTVGFSTNFADGISLAALLRLERHVALQYRDVVTVRQLAEARKAGPTGNLHYFPTTSSHPDNESSQFGRAARSIHAGRRRCPFGLSAGGRRTSHRVGGR